MFEPSAGTGKPPWGRPTWEDGETSHIEELLDSLDLAISRVYRVDPLLYAALLKRRQQLERRLEAIASAEPITRERLERRRNAIEQEFNDRGEIISA